MICELTVLAFFDTMTDKGKSGEKISSGQFGETFSYAVWRSDGDKTHLLHYDAYLLSQ